MIKSPYRTKFTAEQQDGKHNPSRSMVNNKKPSKKKSKKEKSNGT